MSQETTKIKFMDWDQIDTIDVHTTSGERILLINENLSEQMLIELIGSRK